MPTATVSDLIAEARIKTDYTDSEFMSDDEAVILINRARQSLFTQITDKCPSAYFITTTEITIDSDGDGNLPSDFFRARTVEGKVQGGTYYHLTPRALSEATDLDTTLSSYPDRTTVTYYTIHSDQIHVYPNNNVDTVRLRYNAIPANLTATTDTFTTIFHEDRYLVAALCEAIARKDESDATPWSNEKIVVLGEVLATYKPDKSYPKKVVDIRKRYPHRTFNRNLRGRRW